VKYNQRITNNLTKNHGRGASGFNDPPRYTGVVHLLVGPPMPGTLALRNRTMKQTIGPPELLRVAHKADNPTSYTGIVSNPKKTGEVMTRIRAERPYTREKLKPQYKWKPQHVGSFFNTRTARQFMNHPTVRTSTPMGSSLDIKRILNTSIALPHLPVSINGNSAWRLFQGALWVRTGWKAKRVQREVKIRSSKCTSYPNSPTLIILRSLTTISFTWIDFSVAGIGTKIRTDDQEKVVRVQEEKRISSLL